MLVSISFIVVGIACIVFGGIFAVRKKARMFYGWNVEGDKAVMAGIGLIVLGIAVIVFGAFVFPSIVGWSEIRDLLPELQ